MRGKEELLVSRLKVLSEHSRNSNAQYLQLSLKDPVSQLSGTRIAAWKRMISSISTTEAVEQTLMNPLLDYFSQTPVLREYLENHRLDEDRHSVYLARYVKETFKYVKTHRTLSDRVIYDSVLPKVSGLFRKNPLYGFSMILFFEIYGVNFYRQFKRQADTDGLHELSRILTLIQKDESRHFSGIETLISIYVKEKGKPSFKDFLVIKALLKLLVVDVNMSIFGIHNRGVRKSVIQLGISPDDLTRQARNTVDLVCQKIKGCYVEV